jgi:ATP-binding cassette subfamily B protein
MLAEVLGDVWLPKLTSQVIDLGVANHDVAYIGRMGGLMAVCLVFMTACGIGSAYFTAKAAACFAADLRKDVFAKVQGFAFEDLDKFSTGSLITRLTNDVQQIQLVLTMSLRMLMRSPAMLIGALVMALSINKELALVVVVVIPLLAASIGFVMRTAYPRFQVMQEKLDALNNKIQEVLVNIRVIKSFVREGYEEGRFKKANGDLRETSLRAMNVVIWSFPIMMFAMNFTTIAVVWFGGNQIIAGKMLIGDLTAFTVYIVQILMSLMMLSMILLQFSRAQASLSRIGEVLDERVDLTDENAAHKELQVQKGRVEFRGVSFRYDTRNPGAGEGNPAAHSELRAQGDPGRKATGDPETDDVLKDINLTFEAGKTIGILGATGSGKTTLVQLIPRLYDVTEGQVLVDGVDVREYSLKNLRDGVAMVLQKNVLFSGTIEENLRWGDAGATDEELTEFAQAAAADDFIRSFPAAYKSDLGQGGGNVSGGQKQRLCIARALLKHPKVLILDDSTSAVDTATERRIQESFRTTLKDTTKIIIAQRIGSVENADEIVILDDGRVVGHGSHQELLAGNETYQEIYYSQRERNVS